MGVVWECLGVVKSASICKHDYMQKITVQPWTQRGKRRWVVYRQVAGKRKLAFFNSKAEAEAEASRLRLEVQQTGEAWLQLSPGDRQRLMQIYADAQLKGMDLAAIVARGVTAPSVPTLAAAISELIEAKTRSGRNAEYVKTLRWVLNRFAHGREVVPITEISFTDVEGWLNSKDPLGRPTFRARLSGLFNFAIRRGWLLANHCARLETQSVRRSPPRVFTPAEVSRCLAWLADSTAIKLELEMACEALTGEDTPGTVRDRLTALHERIAYLAAELRRVRPNPDLALLASLTRDLAAAEQQLHRYQTQHEGRN